MNVTLLASPCMKWKSMTRSSTPFLSCHEFDRLDADTWPEGPNNAQIDAAIAGCRDRLSMVANLRRYGSVATAKDLRDIRLELGIDQWVRGARGAK